MRTRGSHVSRCPYSFHDVKQRSVLRSRGALLRSGLFAFVAIAFASLPSPAAAVRATAAGRPLPAPAFGPFFGDSSPGARIRISYTTNSLRSQYCTHIVSDLAGANGCRLRIPHHS
jgi:hypothetical protein